MNKQKSTVFNNNNQRRGISGLGEKGEGIKHTKKERTKLTDTDNSGGKEEWGKVGYNKGGINDNRRRLDFGW